MNKEETLHEEVFETFEDGSKVVIRLYPDPDLENPADYDHNWKPYSFSPRHYNYMHPDELLDENGNLSIGIRRKLQVGTAFFMGVFEHGDTQWALSGEEHSCRWDSVRRGGILLWENDVKNLGPKTLEERRNDARGFCQNYTDWCNGHGLGFIVKYEDRDGKEIEDVDSCWGYFSDSEKYALETAREEAQTFVDLRKAEIENTDFSRESLWIDEKYGDMICQFQHVLRHEFRIKPGIDYTYIDEGDEGIIILANGAYLSDVLRVAKRLRVKVKESFTVSY